MGLGHCYELSDINQIQTGFLLKCLFCPSLPRKFFAVSTEARNLFWDRRRFAVRVNVARVSLASQIGHISVYFFAGVVDSALTSGNPLFCETYRFVSAVRGFGMPLE